ncbi:AraC family transcriptional regulator [Burkholderia sp. JSH-S8]|nr:AraC family transcriptional regulator [Burkholderia sp. JSH-S8]
MTQPIKGFLDSGLDHHDEEHTPVSLHTVSIVVNLLAVAGINGEDVLQGTDISLVQVENAEASITYAQELAVLANAKRLYRDPALGLLIGRAIHVSIGGVRGYAMQCAPTFGEAWQFACDHPLTGESYFRMRVEAHGDHAAIVVDGYRFSESLRQLNTEICVAAILTESEDMLGYTAPFTKIEFSFKKSKISKRSYKQLLGCQVEFNAPHTRVIFPSWLLMSKPRFSNRAVFRQLLPRCNQLEWQLANHTKQSATARVTQLLYQSWARYSNLSSVADALGLNSRTLQRRLDAEGSNFNVLAKSVMIDLAKSFLQNSAIPLLDVAEELGYFDVATFSRAFARISGEKPGAYRKMLLSGQREGL